MSHLCRFPLREQDVVALKFDAQLTDAQIAQVMKLPEDTVRTILYRALRKLRQALEQDSHSSSIAGSA
jgi:RNA polymerase sigma-70 factor (ECF subfamily)